MRTLLIARATLRADGKYQTEVVRAREASEDEIRRASIAICESLLGYLDADDSLKSSYTAPEAALNA